MKNIRFKIQNLILFYNWKLEEHWWLMNRGCQMQYEPEKSSCFLNPGDFAEFFTYFNAFSMGKWKKYTNAGDIYLHLRCKGHFQIRLFGHYREGREIKKEFYENQIFNLKTLTDIDIPVPKDCMSQVIGFQITVNPLTDSELALKKKASRNGEKAPDFRFQVESGSWQTIVPENVINDVRISIATTTFKKEDYIKRNIDTLERELFYSDEPCRDRFRLRVVDNGRTLDPEEFNSEYITVFPNDNVGGAGGYARGMLESICSEDFAATHVLLMDDDVLVMTESFLRLYSLLALVKTQYRDRFVSGAMLYYENMNIQHEDVGYVHKDGSYGPNKPIMDMTIWNNVFINEEDTDFHENSYAGWWYCCIPMSKIDGEHLPVPLFIRGDDVEFSLSRKAEFLTLGGICIWHKGFVNKFNAALELYLVHRNSLIIQAMSGIIPEMDFIERIDGFFKTNILRLAYNNCALLLDAIEDYLNGPEFMFTPCGEMIMKEKSTKNEQMISINSFEDIIEEVDFNKIYDNMYDLKPLKGLKRFWYNITWNGHIMAKSFLSNKTAVIPYDWFYSDGRQYMCKQVLAISENGTGHLRERSRKTFLSLMKRRKKLLKRYKKEKNAVYEKYRTAAKTLQSDEFWREYLGI